MKTKLTEILSEKDKKDCPLNAPLIYAEGEQVKINIKNAPLISANFSSRFYRSSSSIFTDFYKPLSQV